MARVVVGMSGGVDSSVAAYLLKKQGYEVVGLFMRNWREKDDEGHCTAEDDYRDVRRVSQLLDIPYFVVDFSEEYWNKVFALFVSEYKAGRTPNPDVLCNKEIKFEAFRYHALKMDADFIATGHYCDILHTDTAHHLLRSIDDNKDQTYFLNQVSGEQLSNTLFPLAKLTKPEVRQIASELGFCTADKKDSTGICFIGERKFREFLSRYIPMQEGDIVDLSGKKVGRHNGVYFYTVGQRRGLGIGGDTGGESWYVIKKDVINNLLYVNMGICPELFKTTMRLDSFNFISIIPPLPFLCKLRIRHRAPLVDCMLTRDNDGKFTITTKEGVRGVAEGQYAVLYSDNLLYDPNIDKKTDGFITLDEQNAGGYLPLCLGGGVVTASY